MAQFNKPGGNEEEKIHIETVSYEEGQYHDYVIKKLDTMIASSKDEKKLDSRSSGSFPMQHGLPNTCIKKDFGVVWI